MANNTPNAIASLLLGLRQSSQDASKPVTSEHSDRTIEALKKAFTMISDAIEARQPKDNVLDARSTTIVKALPGSFTVISGSNIAVSLPSGQSSGAAATLRLVGSTTANLDPGDLKVEDPTAPGTLRTSVFTISSINGVEWVFNDKPEPIWWLKGVF